MGDVTMVPLIDGRRWFAWDGTELWGLLPKAIEPSDWPERLGAMLGVEGCAPLAFGDKRVMFSWPRDEDTGPVLVQVEDLTGTVVVVSRPEHVAALAVLLKLPALDGPA